MADDKIVPPAKAGEESVAAILTKARGLIDEPRKWWKGNSFNPGDRNCICAERALIEAMDNNYLIGTAPFIALQDKVPYGLRLFEYNDHPNTTHADMMNLFDRAISAELSSSQSEGTQ